MMPSSSPSSVGSAMVSPIAHGLAGFHRRFKAIDALRRRARFDRSQADLSMLLDGQAHDPSEEELLADDRLRLIFTCCHPALSADAQVR